MVKGVGPRQIIAMDRATLNIVVIPQESNQVNAITDTDTEVTHPGTTKAPLIQTAVASIVQCIWAARDLTDPTDRPARDLTDPTDRPICRFLFSSKMYIVSF